MKKKTKKKVIIISLSVIFVALILLLNSFGIFNFLFAIVGIQHNAQNIPVTTGNLLLAGNAGTYETPYLGCLTSTSGSKANKYDTWIIAGENDGDLTICNALQDGNTLKLSSSFVSASGYPSQSDKTNYIETKITLPAGTVNVNYNYQVSDYFTSSAGVSFIIDNFSKSFHTSGSGKGHSISGSDSYTFVLTESREIIFRIDTSNRADAESSTGEMTISFIQAPLIQCSDGEEKCIGYDSYNCVNSQWSSAGKVIGKCEVACLSNSNCIPSEGYSCAGNALMKNVTTGSCVSYKCIGSEPVIEKMCTLSCDSKQNLCFENTSKFKIILISSIVFIILIVVLIIFLVKKRK
jgi:hypothetical protein